MPIYIYRLFYLKMNNRKSRSAMVNGGKRNTPFLEENEVYEILEENGYGRII